MKKWSNKLFLIVFIVAIFISLLDSFNSGNIVSKFLPLGSRGIIISFTVFLVILRCFYEIKLPVLLSKINLFILFVSFAVCIALTFWDNTTYVNHAFQVTHIQYSQLWVVSIFCTVVFLLNQTNKWFKKNYKSIILASGFVVFGFALLAWFFPYDFFIEISKEDRFIENTQATVLFLSAIFSLKVASLLYKKNKLHAFVFVFAAIIFIFVFGDEISWGQRIFNLTTPEFLLENNQQKEITVHNLSSVGGFVGIGYATIGFYGVFAWVAQSLFSKLKKFPYFLYIPPITTAFYFFAGFIYNFVTLLIRHKYGNWSEFAELMLYLGIMFTLFNLVVKLNSRRR